MQKKINLDGPSDATLQPDLRPHCVSCRNYDGSTREANFLAPQSTNNGVVVNWVPVCADHCDGWFEGSDFVSPVFILQYFMMGGREKE